MFPANHKIVFIFKYNTAAYLTVWHFCGKQFIRYTYSGHPYSGVYIIKHSLVEIFLEFIFILQSFIIYYRYYNSGIHCTLWLFMHVINSYHRVLCALSGHLNEPSSFYISFQPLFQRKNVKNVIRLCLSSGKMKILHQLHSPAWVLQRKMGSKTFHYVRFSRKKVLKTLKI